MGKAHAVALTNTGLVYTLGINNKGQCGREFGYTKESKYLLIYSKVLVNIVFGDDKKTINIS